MDHRNTRTEKKMCHKNGKKWQKMLNFGLSEKLPETNSSHGAKQSPSSSPLCWPSAGFGGPRASAWFWPFDPRLVIEIAHISTNPQRTFQRTLRALSWLNMSSIEQREESLRSGNVSQKMSKFLKKCENWHFLRN